MSTTTGPASESPMDRVLDRLDGVKPAGDRKWLARCPAHDDRHPSLSVAEGDSGAVLLRCWAGCDFGAIVEALGLEPGDLFPRREGHHRTAPIPKRERWPARQVLKAICDDALVVLVAAEDIARGVALSEEDRQFVAEAAGRIREAAREAGCNV